MENKYIALGVMSGSSLDGIDLARCEFIEKNGTWSFRIIDAETIAYSDEMRHALTGVMLGTALDLARLHRDLGKYIGVQCKAFLKGVTIDVIGSHGHTIFHKPTEGLTTQIGCGAHIAALSGNTTVCDLRTTDVALGGQGAPLVPLGEKLLFPDNKVFLNIGGICNISLHAPESVIGYDVCIGNQALNHLAEEEGHPFDDEGRMARSGSIDQQLLEKLNTLPFHSTPPPRSLGREWFEEAVLPLISYRSIPLPDRMRTVVEHVALQVCSATKGSKGSMMVTGGGAHNSFLMERIKANTDQALIMPDELTINYKEALIFALLGVLRMREDPTALASVTGATWDSVCGAVYLGDRSPGRDISVRT